MRRIIILASSTLISLLIAIWALNTFELLGDFLSNLNFLAQLLQTFDLDIGANLLHIALLTTIITVVLGKVLGVLSNHG